MKLPKTIPVKDLKLRVILVSEHKKDGTNDKSLKKYKDEFLYANLDKDEFE